MDKLGIVKLGVAAVVGSGASKIVSAIVRNNVSPEKVTDKVAIASATFVIGGVVAERSKQYTDQTIDEIAKFYHENVKPKFAK